MIQDGLYQWNHVQAFGPSTPVLAQVSGGELVRYNWGTDLDIPVQPEAAVQLLAQLRQRIADHARWGAHLEFTPALTLTLTNPVTGPATVQLYPGGAA